MRAVEQPIDLRSDTVTTPTPAMRRAMAEAEVGDDVYDEDPTVHRLQERAAELMGKEAALFFPTGTMANQAAVLAHTRRGQEILVEAHAHVYHSEAGGVAVLAGCHPRPFHAFRGVPTPEDIEALLRPDDEHYPPTSLLCLENTHNLAGGTVIPVHRMIDLAATAHRHGLAVHLDGARIFNAATALGVAARDLAAPADSVMFCLSKGLAAPIGSMLCGSREFIARARRARKLLGGGMRQVGVIAAAGLVALDEMIGRLAEDHANARRLAEGLADLPPLAVDLDTVQTNMVMCDVSGFEPAPAFARRLAAAGVLVNAVNDRRVRFVTHKDVDAADIDRALAIVSDQVRARVSR
ncbi:MAG TPA: low-specificity L-threonine aldolase [Bacillota bacterium]